MLDENLPTFIFRPMPDHPSSAVVYFTRSGSDPAPEYVLRLADPVSKPACRGVYAAALTDPYNSNDVVYGEVAVKPEWQQPTLSAAEIREHRERGGGNEAAAATAAKTPDSFAVQLYNPDQAVSVRWTSGSWNRTESWEFEIPIETFRMPSASRLDRQQQPTTSLGEGGGGGGGGDNSSTSNAVAPKNAFRWKRDGRLGNKDMTCYMIGQTVGLHRSKEPDITIALFKHGRDPAVTIYEPNLQRVDVQDRKGLDLVLLLSAQVIRDLYVVPRPDPFNMEGGGGAAAAAAAGGATAAAAGGRRKNSRPSGGATNNDTAAQQQRPNTIYTAVPTTTASAVPKGGASSVAAAAAAGSTPSAAAIDAETKRLQVMLEREERERAKREREEEKRIKKMLEAEEKEARLRDAQVAKETERLRKMYGVQGQDLPSTVPPPAGPPPARPSTSSPYSGRPVPPPPPPPPPATSSGYHNSYYYPQQQQQHQHPPLPPRPVSAGPSSQSTLSSWWHGPAGGGTNGGYHPTSSSNNSGGNSNTKKPKVFLSNPAAGVSGFFSSSSASGNNRDRASSSAAAATLGVGDDRSRIHKKRSVHF